MESLLKYVPQEFITPSENFQSALKRIALHYWYMNIPDQRVLLGPDLMQRLSIEGDSLEKSLDKLRSVIHSDDRDELLKMYERVLQGIDKVLETDMRIRIGNDWVWHYLRGSVIYTDDDGKPVIFGGITMDMSRRYNRMLDRIEAGKKFEFIFRQTTQPVFIGTMRVGDQPGKIIEVNEAACELMQCNQEQLIGMSPYNLINDPGIASGESLTEQFRETMHFSHETEIQTFGGDTRFVEITAHAFKQDNEELFIAVVNDLTESRKIRRELQKSESAQRKSERIYRSLIHAADDRIGLFDLDGNVEVMNDSYYQMLGYTKEEFKEQKLSEKMHPEDVEELEHHMEVLRSKGAASFDYRVQHKQGYYLHMSAKGVLIEDPDLEKKYLLFIIRDITEQVEFAEELIRAKEQAEESDQLKSAFLANISHEIRTPMNSIVGFANLLSESGMPEEEKQEYIERINKNSSQLLALISDIIDLAKIESNQLSINYNRVLIDHIMQELLQFARLQLKLKEKENLKVDYDPDPDYKNPSFDTDLIRIAQILQNLVSNAIKFTAEGAITLGYRIINDDRVQLFVKDTGTGIKKEHYEVIFDQFRQLDGTNTRRFGGTGLGLAITRNLTQLMNGRIWVDSTPGQGSCFYVEFPIKSKGFVKDVVIFPSEEDHKAIHADIMVVDDDPDSLMLISTILKKEGMSVSRAATGYEALEKIEQEGVPDLMLVDLQMPVLNGMQTMKIAKEKHPGIKVIAQSAHGYDGDSLKFLKQGFDDYLPKPYTRNQLIKLVQSYLK